MLLISKPDIMAPSQYPFRRHVRVPQPVVSGFAKPVKSSAGAHSAVGVLPQGETGRGGKWFVLGGGGGGLFEPLEGGGAGGKGAPVTNLLLNLYLGSLSAPSWGPETTGVMSSFCPHVGPREGRGYVASTGTNSCRSYG